MKTETLIKGLRKIGKCRKAGIDLEPYLERFSKSSCPTRFSYLLLSERRSEDGHYSKKFKSRHPLGSVYYDASYGFVLAVRMFSVFKIPIAVIGFEADTSDSTITIKQVQGVKDAADFLAGIRWEKLLVSVVVDWARLHGAKKVEIIRAEDGPWHRGADLERAARMHLHYDVTAKRCGFRLDEKTNRYTLHLTS